MTKRGIMLAIIVVSLLFSMFISFSSAFSFSDFFGKITGNAVNEGCPSNLVAYYKLDNNVQDSSANGKTGTLVGAPSIVPGKLGNAYYFNGSTAIDIGNIDFSNQEFTISSWIRTTDPGQYNNYREWISKVGYWETGTFEFNIHAPNNANGVATMGWSSGRGIYGMEDRNVNVRDGNWHHIVGTYKRGNQSLYVDGVLTSTNSYTGELPITSQTVQIGGTDWHYYHHRWVGDIDEVAIYNKALSSSDVSNLYNNGNGKDVCSSNTPSAQNIQQCSDSDGINEIIKGYVNVSLCQNLSGQIISCNTSISFDTDYCINNSTLGEYTCSNNNRTLFPVNCSSGNCSNGICVNATLPAPEECVDACSLNICSGNGFLSCLDINADGCKEINPSIVPCQEGTVCQNGNCVLLTANPVCGNGLLETGEECDLGNNNGLCPSSCSLTCKINNDCANSIEAISPVNLVNIQETIATQPSCEGCILNGTCLPIGYRIEIEGNASFCDISGIKEQKKNTENITQTCQNSFECESNLCSAGECVEIIGSKATLVRFICRLSHLNDEEKYLSCINQYIYGIESVSSTEPVNIQQPDQIAPPSTPSCISNWSCGAWSLCDKNNRNRICYDINNCGTTEGKPSTSEVCDTENLQKAPSEIVEVTSTQQSFTWWNPSTWTGVANSP